MGDPDAGGGWNYRWHAPSKISPVANSDGLDEALLCGGRERAWAPQESGLW